MLLLLNLLLALVIGFIVYRVMIAVKSPEWLALIAGLVMGLVIFLANIAAELV